MQVQETLPNEVDQIQQDLEKMLQDHQSQFGLPRVAALRQRLISLLGDNSDNLKRFDRTIVDFYSNKIVGDRGQFGPEFSEVQRFLSQNTKIPTLHAQICAVRMVPLFQDMPAAVRDQLAEQEKRLLIQFAEVVQHLIEAEYTQKAIALQTATKDRAGFNAYLKANAPDQAKVELTTKMMLHGFGEDLKEQRDNALFQQLVLPPIVRLYEQHIFNQAANFGESADYEDVLFALAFYYRLRLTTSNLNDYSDVLLNTVLEAMLSVKTTADKQWNPEKIKSHLEEIRLECFEHCKNSSLHRVINNPENQSWEKCEEEIGDLFDTQYKFVNRRLQRTVTTTLDHDFARVQFDKRVHGLIYGEGGFISKIRGQNLSAVLAALEECVATQQRLLQSEDFSMLAKEDKSFKSSLFQNLLTIISDHFNVGILVLQSFVRVAELANTLNLPEQAEALVKKVNELLPVTYRSKSCVDDVLQLMHQYQAILDCTLDSAIFNLYIAPVLAARFEEAIMTDLTHLILGYGSTNHQGTVDLVLTSYRLKLRATADFSDALFQKYAAFLTNLEAQKPTAQSDLSSEVSAKDRLSQLRVKCFSTHLNSPLRTSIASEVENLMKQGNSPWQAYSEAIEAAIKKDHAWLPQAAVQSYLAEFREKYARQNAEAPQASVFFAQPSSTSPRTTQLAAPQAEATQAAQAHDEGLVRQTQFH